MQLESHGVATGDPDNPFLARITVGARQRQETMHEWPAGSLRQAQQQADDWLNEYRARLCIGDERILEPMEMRARWKRFESAKSLPDLPEPVPEYYRALERVSATYTEGELDRVLSPRTRRTYPNQARVRSTVKSARAAGIDVAGIRLWPDGSIAAFDRRACMGAIPPTEVSPDDITARYSNLDGEFDR